MRKINTLPMERKNKSGKFLKNVMMSWLAAWLSIWALWCWWSPIDQDKYSESVIDEKIVTHWPNSVSVKYISKEQLAFREDIKKIRQWVDKFIWDWEEAWLEVQRSESDWLKLFDKWLAHVSSSSEELSGSDVTYDWSFTATNIFTNQRVVSWLNYIDWAWELEWLDLFTSNDNKATVPNPNNKIKPSALFHKLSLC